MKNFKHTQSQGTNLSPQNPIFPAGFVPEPETAPEQATPPASPVKRSTHSATLSSDTPPLTPWESQELAGYEAHIKQSRTEGSILFCKTATAAAAIRGKRLYRGTHPSFAAYFKAKWAVSRAHANRLADAGTTIERQKMSPRGDIIKSMGSEAHFRPLAKLDDSAQDAVIDVVGKWKAWDDQGEISPRMVHGAVLFLNPPARPRKAGTRENPLAAKFIAAVEAARNELPKNVDKEVIGVLVRLRQKASALGESKRTSGIEWTQKTWNPLHGCCPISTAAGTRQVD